MAGNKIILNKRSNAVNGDGTPKIPTSGQLQYGEIAINYAAGVETLSIKNSKDNIVTLPINQQNIKKLLFNDLWLSLPGCKVNGENYSFIKNSYTYENAIKKYHELLALNSNYKMIDLGLTSGTLWADRNIGATDIYDGGKLFQWGDPTPYDIPEHTGNTINAGQKMFSDSDYKWNPSGDGSTFTKYNGTDGKTTFDPEDDAAHVNMGGTWKMPTQEQVTELFKETTQELYAKLTDSSVPVKVANGAYNKDDGYVSWTYDGHTSDEASGKLAYMKLLSKSNGNFLVVPSSVYAREGKVYTVANGGQFWLSSFSSQDIVPAWYGYFTSSHYGVELDFRHVGFGVRGVVGQ